MTRHYTPRKSLHDWQQIVDLWQHSGLATRQFCDQHHLSYESFCKWRRRLAATVDGTRSLHAEPAFIDLSSLRSTVTPAGWEIVLKLGNGVELHLSPR